MSLRLLLVSIVAFFMATPEAIAQQARLLTDTVVPGDLVTLEVQYRDTRSSMLELNTQPLEADFEVVDIKPSMKMDRQAGSYTTVMNWQVLLAPKRSGKITIPSLQIREATTPELQLTVKAVNPWQEFQEDVRLELSVDKRSPRIGEPFTVTLRFFHNRPIIAGLLRDPQVTGATRLGLGRDRLYPLNLNGIQYEVLERSIAFFAESAGSLTINPAEYRGSLRAMPSIAGLSGLRQFRRLSQPLVVRVRSLPGGIDAPDWYPFEDAALTQQWQIPEGPLKPGDKILRRIELKTTGLPPQVFDAQLFQSEVRGADVFLDQPQQILRTGNGKIEAEFLQDQLFILSREGPVLLPELSLDYWDTALDQPASIRIPGRLIDVPPLVSDFSRQPGKTGFSMDLPSAVVALSGCLLVIGGLIRWLAAIKTSRLTGYRLSELKAACQRDDAVTAARLLLAWGRIENLLLHSNGLRALAAAVDDDLLQTQLLQLDAAIFGSEQPRWQGKQLWMAFRRYRSPSTLKPISTVSLPPLYRGTAGHLPINDNA